ncbi:MAG: CHAD domain-containing protein [Acidimicrobiia bacterium]|nr:CHAD domain-containing protein [Acidimicrobiia bacterium]
MDDTSTPEAPSTLTCVRFFAGETLAEGLTRVIDAQFGIAVAITSTPPEEQTAAVHETRKAIKRLRAMLRLVRDSISLDVYHTDNAALKLIAAELGAVRDAWVMAEILDRLLPHDEDTAAAVDELVERLQERYRAESAAVLGNQAHLASIMDQLQNARERAARWTVVAGEQSVPLPHEFATVAPGLQRVYKRGRRGMRIVADSPTDTLLHVWRKRAKYLRHQVEALNVLDPEPLAEMEERLANLTDLLGDDHDLAVLLNRFHHDGQLVADIPMDGVLTAVHENRQRLQEDAITLGQDIFEEHSSFFLSYIESVWREGATF